MEYKNNLIVENIKIKGWKCSKCGEEYYNETEKIEALLWLNRLKKKGIKAKLGRNRTNLILRIPKNIETALGLHEGELVTLRVENKELKLIPA